MTNIYSKTETDNLLASKQATLTAGTSLLGVGSAISALDYNKITLNKPSTFPPDLTNIYTKTQVDGITTLTNFYNKTTSDGLYLKLTGGQLTGNLGFGVAPSSSIYINCYNASSTAFQNIQMTNNANDFFYFGIAGNGAGNGSYLNNFFIQSSKGLVFNSMNKTHTGVPDMIINNNSVGINTTAPNTTYKLDVNGGINGTTLFQGGTSIATTYATITALNAKENTLTFNSPLTRNTNTIGIDLSAYLTTASAGTTYATITALNAKENTLTFSAPLSRATNTISIDLSAYSTTATNNTNYLRLSVATNDLSGKLAFLILLD
jgi:hypothetical protein